MSRPGDAGATVALILFGWGGLRLALPAAQVLAMRQPRPEDASSVGDFLGLPSGPTALVQNAYRTLCLAGPGEPLAIRVEEPVVHCQLPAAALHPLPRAIAGRLQTPSVRAIACLEESDGARLAIVLDATRLAAADPRDKLPTG